MAAHTSSKQPVNLTINHAVLMEARKYKINISHALEKALAELNKQRRMEKWLEENQPGLEAYNRFVEKYGIFGDHVRSF